MQHRPTTRTRTVPGGCARATARHVVLPSSFRLAAAHRTVPSADAAFPRQRPFFRIRGAAAPRPPLPLQLRPASLFVRRSGAFPCREGQASACVHGHRRTSREPAPSERGGAGVFLRTLGDGRPAGADRSPPWNTARSCDLYSRRPADLGERLRPSPFFSLYMQGGRRPL